MHTLPNPDFKGHQHTPESFYSVRRQVTDMLAIVDQLASAGYHHCDPHAKAMRRAHLAAHRAFSENRIGDGFKALGSFWNIHAGYVEEEPAFNRES
jgi:hypothetical protein